MEQREMERLAWLDLKSKGFVIDSRWEGDGRTWIGCYAMPKDKPPFWADVWDENSIQKDGNDYAQWFEWYTRDLNQLAKEYPQ